MSRVVSKELLLDNVGRESPGVGLYSGIKDGTFEAIKEGYKRKYPELTKELMKELEQLRKGKKNTGTLTKDPSRLFVKFAKKEAVKQPQSGLGTFTTQQRFRELTSVKKLKETVPYAYQAHSSIGRSPSKAQLELIEREAISKLYSPQLRPRYYEAAQDNPVQTFFGIPKTHFHGPGPVQHHNETQLAFRSLSPRQIRDYEHKQSLATK